MARFNGRPTLIGLFLSLILLALAPVYAVAAPYAAMVMDARTGEVLHSRNADTRLHPASLTKMMTLYIVFEAVENGEISLDTVVTIPAQAAAEPPSKLGLRTGQRIRLRYLIRGAAVKSANDAATALAFAIEGSEAAFARRMNRTAEALGMTRTTFRNAHGLTAEGHLSTARDMTTLGRHLIYDYPQYYNLFSRLTTDAGVRQVPNTNRRLLRAYRGADGIKTGYTRAAGFNLVASAERGNTRIIATVFGGTSSAQRNARVAELLDMGFARAPASTRVQPPQMPAYAGSHAGSARTTRITGAVTRSLRPRARPAQEQLIAVDSAAIADAVAIAAQVAATTAPAPEPAQTDTAEPETATLLASAAAVSAPARMEVTPPTRPGSLVPITPAAARKQEEVLTSLSTSGDHHWGINVGRYTTRAQAERVLIRVALNEVETLDGALRQVQSTARGHDATFSGLTRETADLACRRLQARGTTCFMVGP